MDEEGHTGIGPDEDRPDIGEGPGTGAESGSWSEPPFQPPPPPSFEPPSPDPQQPDPWGRAPWVVPQPPAGGWPPALPPAPPTGLSRRSRAALAAILAGLVLLGGGIGIGWGISRSGQGGYVVQSQAPLHQVPQDRPAQNGAGLDLDAIAAKVDPGVVDIMTVLYGVGDQPRGRAAGTGMVLTSSGQVLTNNHVIAGATSITVIMPGQQHNYTATVIGADPTDDIALLQVQGASGWHTVTLADSSDLTVGQSVAAIGNAFGQGGTPSITEGTITALNQAIDVSNEQGVTEQLSNLIQTSAPVSPGDSGGPLVNAAGQVIGMITAGRRSDPFPSTSSTSFAISLNSAIEVVNQIRSGQADPTIVLGDAAFLGVEVRSVDASTAASIGLNGTSGALVTAVIPDTPAAGTAMTAGSVITAIDGQAIDSPATLGPAIYSHDPGQRISVTWVDQSGTHTATVTLIAGPAV